MTEKPYIEQIVTVTEKHWNPRFDQDAPCVCGHVYYRHFDTWDDMAATGCKYCECHEFRCDTAHGEHASDSKEG